MDVKYLRKVPNLYGLILGRVISAYQYTAQDVATGITFFGVEFFNDKLHAVYISFIISFVILWRR
ncbi:MAG: hypothetical protein ABIL40_08540 [candidate division WOR-3 bacterium]